MNVDVRPAVSAAAQRCVVAARHVIGRFFLIATVLLGSVAFGPPAEAALIVTLSEVGSDVVANGSGTVDMAALTLVSNEFDPGAMWPAANAIVLGSAPTASLGYYYSGMSGPSNFGSGGSSVATSGSGDHFGLFGGAPPVLLLPSGYFSGASLSATDTWASESFATLGVTPGT